MEREAATRAELGLCSPLLRKSSIMACQLASEVSEGGMNGAPERDVTRRENRRRFSSAFKTQSTGANPRDIRDDDVDPRLRQPDPVMALMAVLTTTPPSRARLDNMLGSVQGIGRRRRGAIGGVLCVELQAR